jgi:protein phosphatase 1 regulatory subunit 42
LLAAPLPRLPASPQGKAALVQHFQNSSLLHEDKRCRPILFHTNGTLAGEIEQFPGTLASPALPGGGGLGAAGIGGAGGSSGSLQLMGEGGRDL